MEYEELLTKYTELQKDAELFRQEAHSANIRLKTAEETERFYEEEVRLLNLRLDKNLAFDKKVVKEDNQQIHCIEEKEEEIQRQNAVIETLKTQLKDAKNSIPVIPNTIDEELLAHNSNLKDEVHQLHEIIKVNQAKLDTVQQEYRVLQSQLENVINELEQHKEIAEIRNIDAQETRTLLSNLKDENVWLKSELDAVNSKPLDSQSKGNSLFAEVNDRRVQLQENVNVMKTEYLEMKRQRARQMQQISALQNEIQRLMLRWNSEVTEKQQDEDIIIYALRDEVKLLKKLNDDYKKHLEEKFQIEDAQGLEAILYIKNVEMEKLREEMRAKATGFTMLSFDLAEVRKESRKKSIELLQLKNEISQLKLSIEEKSLCSNIEKNETEDENKDNEVLPKKSNLKQTIKSENEDILEEKESKKKEETIVQFADSVNEPHITHRKRGKVISVAPRIY